MHLILLWELFQETEEKTKATMHSREKDKKYILESTDWTKLFFFTSVPTQYQTGKYVGTKYMWANFPTLFLYDTSDCNSSEHEVKSISLIRIKYKVLPIILRSHT